VGFAFMEFLWPCLLGGFPASARETFQKFRTPGMGEKMILKQCIRGRGSSGATARKLTDEEMSVYRARFLLPRRGDPLGFPNELPIAGRTGGCAFNLRESTSCSSALVLPKLLFAGNQALWYRDLR